jgi:hypothetical protein
LLRAGSLRSSGSRGFGGSIVPIIAGYFSWRLLVLVVNAQITAEAVTDGCGAVHCTRGPSRKIGCKWASRRCSDRSYTTKRGSLGCRSRNISGIFCCAGARIE